MAVGPVSIVIKCRCLHLEGRLYLVLAYWRDHLLVAEVFEA